MAPRQRHAGIFAALRGDDARRQFRYADSAGGGRKILNVQCPISNVEVNSKAALRLIRRRSPQVATLAQGKQIGPKNSAFGGNQTTNDTIVRLGGAIKLIGH